MDKIQKGNSAVKGLKLRRIIKKGTASLLAVALAFLPPVPGLTITALAAGTELQPAQGMKAMAAD